MEYQSASLIHIQTVVNGFILYYIIHTVPNPTIIRSINKYT